MNAPWKHHAARFQVQLFRALMGSFIGGAVLGITFALLGDLLHLGVTVTLVQKLVTTSPFPLQSAVALLLGLYVSPRMDRKYACLVWTVGTAYLLIRIALFHSGSVFASSRWAHFFGDECRLPGCWDQFTVTAPWMISVAYSVGAGLQGAKHWLSGSNDSN